MSDEFSRRPPRPTFDEPPPRRGGWFGFVFALSVGIALLGGIIFLSFIWLGAVIVIAIGIMLALFHYVVWGWWLGRVLREEELPEEEPRNRKRP